MLNEPTKMKQANKQNNNCNQHFYEFCRYVCLHVYIWKACMAVSLSIFHEHSFWLLLSCLCSSHFLSIAFQKYFICPFWALYSMRAVFQFNCNVFFFLVRALSNLTWQSLNPFLVLYSHCVRRQSITIRSTNNVFVRFEYWEEVGGKCAIRIPVTSIPYKHTHTPKGTMKKCQLK